jgi:hypothetical protein
VQHVTEWNRNMCYLFLCNFLSRNDELFPPKTVFSEEASHLHLSEVLTDITWESMGVTILSAVIEKMRNVLSQTHFLLCWKTRCLGGPSSLPNQFWLLLFTQTWWAPSTRWGISAFPPQSKGVSRLPVPRELDWQWWGYHFAVSLTWPSSLWLFCMGRY